MRKLSLLLCMLMPGITGLSAQDLTITGKVTDEKGNALPGVSVTGKNTVTTKADGTFSISVSRNVKSLTFSYGGYASGVAIL